MSVCSSILDVVFPRRCAGCARADTWLCASCAMNVQQPLYQTLTNTPLHSLFTLGSYTTPAMRTTIRSMKFHRVTDLARLFGTLLGNALRNTPTLREDAIVVAVPLHARRRRARGFDQAEMIAVAMAHVLDIPFIANALIRKRATPPQARRHLQDRFAVPRFDFCQTEILLPPAKHILLVDDVVTTGATILAAANALQQNHPAIIHGVAIARPS